MTLNDASWLRPQVEYRASPDGRQFRGETMTEQTTAPTLPGITKPRWHATVTYENGRMTHNFDEFEELGEIIERGANLHLIKRITISLNNHGDE
jgi:hypothetical protein